MGLQMRVSTVETPRRGVSTGMVPDLLAGSGLLLAALAWQFELGVDELPVR